MTRRLDVVVSATIKGVPRVDFQALLGSTATHEDPPLRRRGRERA
ncbi:hypothetical protein [Nesterenkonia sp. Act20]|nr:hypothetical protein [Nesterenkonia sp. Act20]